MIKGENVNLRPICKEDFDLIYTWNTNQEYLGKYMDAEMRVKDSALADMERAVASNRISFFIIEDKEGRAIGIINYLNSMATTEAYDFGILVANNDKKGKGVGTEALNLFIDYIFNTKNIMRLQFITRSDNYGMKKLGEKSGFTLEGTLRKYKFENGDYRDYCLYGIIRDDWRKLIK
ncbi:GNAT family N-acetyltransferase [Clostridium sp. 'White wine YQ']|uniref:GNAT family N-acetyltransferase n=1 Tax=Clostridium sp. 'White wine YQ' TaxID=3027474 RepID=UPI002366CCC5|nr:GNAT family protein [Clostridium sp. 'White wine YQ']MDD7793165.1 GNAT family protein [Clostridium sp. 'White wine YQ']